MVVGRLDGNLDIDIIGRSALPEGIDSIAGALGFDGGAAMSCLGVEQRGGRIGLLAFEIDLCLLQRQRARLEQRLALMALPAP